VTAESREELVARLSRTLTLRDGTRVLVRPIVPDDKQALVEGMRRLSPESRYLRFMSPVAQLSDAQLAYLTEVDYHEHFAYVAFAVDDPEQPGIAVARYVRLPDDPTIAEPAVAVVDEYHRRGLGSLLLILLAARAAAAGVTSFRAYVLIDNRPMRDLLTRFGGKAEIEEPGVLRIDVPLPSDGRIRLETVVQILRALGEGELRRAQHRLRRASWSDDAG
jgi:GNAT superfamily N-acetyltransferase